MNQDDKEQEGILSTVQSAVVHSAQAGLEVAKSGIESGKDAAQAPVARWLPLRLRRRKLSENRGKPPLNHVASQNDP